LPRFFAHGKANNCEKEREAIRRLGNPVAGMSAFAKAKSLGLAEEREKQTGARATPAAALSTDGGMEDALPTRSSA
jgi:hypothetical protein